MIASIMDITDTSGTVSFMVPFAPPPEGCVVTATASKLEPFMVTSEFGNPLILRGNDGCDRKRAAAAGNSADAELSQSIQSDDDHRVFHWNRWTSDIGRW